MVVDYSPALDDARIDRLFHALAHATRRDIVRRVLTREHSVSELSRAYDVSFAAVQKHVAVLEEAELVVKRAEGRERLVRADPRMLARAQVLLDEFEQLWRGRVDRLDALLADETTEPIPPTEPDPAP